MRYVLTHAEREARLAIERRVAMNGAAHRPDLRTPYLHPLAFPNWMAELQMGEHALSDVGASFVTARAVQVHGEFKIATYTRDDIFAWARAMRTREPEDWARCARGEVTELAESAATIRAQRRG